MKVVLDPPTSIDYGCGLAKTSMSKKYAPCLSLACFIYVDGIITMNILEQPCLR